MAAPVTRHQLRRGKIIRARAEEFYPEIEAGAVSLLISDGPYKMATPKAEWDKFASWEAFVDWYAPHIEAWGRVCAPSATVYLWGTDEGEGYLRAPMREAGWTFRGSVVWDKRPVANSMSWSRASGWPDATERCGVWARGAPSFTLSGPSSNVWSLPAANLGPERLHTGRLVRAPLNAFGGGSGMAQEALHPCQKPLAFYDRMIRASSRPGDLVLEPFGGTCRAAVAIERMPEAEARRYVCVEPDEDGRDYLPAVLRSLTLDPDTSTDRQPSLFA